jgi:hypothetical protein
MQELPQVRVGLGSWEFVVLCPGPAVTQFGETSFHEITLCLPNHSLTF